MEIKNKIIIHARTYIYKEKFFLKNLEKSLWIKKKYVYLQCNQNETITRTPLNKVHKTKKKNEENDFISISCIYI